MRTSYVIKGMSITLDRTMAEKKSRSITKTVKQFGDKLLGFVRQKVNSEEDVEDIAKSQPNR